MSGFLVDLDHLDQTVLRLRRLETLMEDRLALADRRVRDLHESWHGDAASAQLVAHEEWVLGAEQMRLATMALRVAAATAHENYSCASRTNGRGWSR